MSLTFDDTYSYGGHRELQVVGTPGDRLRGWFRKVTFDSSYPTGGESIDLSSVFSSVLTMVAQPVYSAGLSKLVVPIYDATNAKILLYDAAAGTEITNTADASDVVFWAMFYGLAY